ncbi:hypothetical protein [Bosea sp. ANAM02]|uniref:hypothetical protein n=1 Tax=Bosea sp. ANAM02 TaxID=2020412 RepID=UPI00140EEB3F|nr:hypothetical protein [Bosea sp. ANAM02]BCB21979.1 hypothetical protein OCUBac02_48730 [Bosea sp. ANAM02]
MSEAAATVSTTRSFPEVPHLDQLMQVRGRLVELGLDTEAEALGQVYAAGLVEHQLYAAALQESQDWKTRARDASDDLEYSEARHLGFRSRMVEVLKRVRDFLANGFPGKEDLDGQRYLEFATDDVEREFEQLSQEIRSRKRFSMHSAIEASIRLHLDWPVDRDPDQAVTDTVRDICTDIDCLIEKRVEGLMAEATAGSFVPAEFRALTFAVQHNPNCPSPWLVRLPGKGAGSIDMKAYGVTGSGLGLIPHETKDALGFGKTFASAGAAALQAQSASAGNVSRK